MTTPPVEQPPVAKTSGYAITSFVSSLLGVCPLAIIFGHMALSQIKKSGGQLGGYGIALAGTIIGYVTIPIVLSLVAILFVGARAWKKGADRSACLMNIRNVQMAIRGHQNMNSIDNGETIEWNLILGPSGYMEEPVCPVHGAYHVADTYPPLGVTVFTCPGEEHYLEPSVTSQW